MVHGSATVCFLFSPLLGFSLIKHWLIVVLVMDLHPTVVMELAWSGCSLGCATSILFVILACTRGTWDDALHSSPNCVSAGNDLAGFI